MSVEESTWVWGTFSQIWEFTTRKLDALVRSYQIELITNGQDPGEPVIERKNVAVRIKSGKINEVALRLIIG